MFIGIDYAVNDTGSLSIVDASGNVTYRSTFSGTSIKHIVSLCMQRKPDLIIVDASGAGAYLLEMLREEGLPAHEYVVTPESRERLGQYSDHLATALALQGFSLSKQKRIAPY